MIDLESTPPRQRCQDHPGRQGSPRRLWWIVAAFLAVQVYVICFAANGPFVDEGLYTVAGMRVLEGKGLSDGYITWFNGSPFVWPVIAALGHRLGGLPGARFMAAILSTVTLVAFARTAENLFGQSVAEWCALAFAVNGLFMALAHFAVYDVAALAGVAVSMWCVTHSSTTVASMWLIGAAIAFAGAVISKYGSMLMVVPLLGLLVSVRGFRSSGRALAVFLSVAGVILTAYFSLFFGSLFPTSSAAYLEQAFGRSRGHIAALQVVFALAPFSLASVGALVAWRRRQRLLVVTCLLALSLYPLFHLWSANFVSAQKHVVAGFLFAYLLAGLALERLWASRSRVTPIIVLAVLTIWGGLQCYWQDRSWSDTRTLAHYLALNMKSGDRIVAESSWNYILYLYPRGLIESPADVIDANYPPRRNRLDVCQIPWLVGNPDSADMIRAAVGHCRHQNVLSSTTQQYYFDTTQRRLGVSSVVVGLYRLPQP
jgi:4-amino-4-deoxy-L-arabinose transferase-like glycosyltransferase